MTFFLFLAPFLAWESEEKASLRDDLGRLVHGGERERRKHRKRCNEGVKPGHFLLHLFPDRPFDPMQ
jgi:hypothetical protein